MGVEQTGNPIAGGHADVITVQAVDVHAVTENAPVVVVASKAPSRKAPSAVAAAIGFCLVYFVARGVLSTEQAVDSEDGDTGFRDSQPEREPAPYPVHVQRDPTPAQPAVVVAPPPPPAPVRSPPPPARPPRVSLCDAAPCLNGAQCFAGQGTEYLCSCAAGFHGVTCEIAEVNGCTDAAATNYDAAATHDDGSCASAPVRRNPCDATPCLNGAVCTAGQADSFWCACASGFVGVTCEVAEVLGCTDHAATNFDSAATRDDSSCVMAPLPRDCVGVWSQCLADCSPKRFRVLQTAVSTGNSCEAADQAITSCAPGEGTCPMPLPADWELLGGSITAENPLTAGQMSFYGEYSAFEPDTPWPGGRSTSVTWPADDGLTTYLFGGYGRGEAAYHSQSWMNDLWTVYYNSSDAPSGLAWTFVSGSMRTNGKIFEFAFKTRNFVSKLHKNEEFLLSKTRNSVLNMMDFADGGQYTALHQAGGVPRSRGFSQGWKGAANTGWLFGGQTWGSGATALLNDLWQINLADGSWTWRGGRATSSSEVRFLLIFTVLLLF